MKRAASRMAVALVVVAGGCGGGGAGGPADESCGFSDGEPNNDPGHATGYALASVHQGCLSVSDVDHLLVAAPSDQTGGIVRATVANPGEGNVRVMIYDAAGTQELGAFASDAPGAAVSFFFAISPGNDARIAIADAGGATVPRTYELTTSYEPVPDAFEPNDAEGAAAPMTAGAAVQGYLFAGSGAPAEAYDDFYRFSAAGGTVRISLDDVATDLAARVFLYSSDGSEIARVSTGLKGGPLSMQPPMPLAVADYVIRVSLWASPPTSFGQGDALPEHFTRPYRLTLM